MGKTTKSQAKVQETIESKTEDKTTFFYYAFRNTILVSLPFTIISALLLSLPHSSALESSSDRVNLVVPISCNLTATIPSGKEHTISMVSGTYEDEIGETILKTSCNDANGYVVYAIGNTDNTEGKNVLSAMIGSTYDIPTGTATSGDTSAWAMKLSPIANSSLDTPTIEPGYNSYHTIPNTWTKVVSKSSNTDISEGSSFSTTYAIYLKNAQPAGTYSGQVKYAMFHPSSTPPPTSIEGALAANHKEKYNGYYKMQDMTPTICSMVNIYGEASQTQLIDVRDENVYWVAKLNDNNCWMTQNLDLDLSHEVALTSETSDIDPSTYGNGIYTSATGYSQSGNIVSWTPSTIENNAQQADTKAMTWSSDTAATVTGWTNNTNNPYSADAGYRYRYTNTSGTETVYTSLNACLSGTNNDEAGCKHAHLGNYYNWSSAVASNNTNGASSSQTNSICPKNWNLPINGEYSTMLDAQDVWAGTNYDYDTDGYLKIRTAPLYFVQSGLVNGGTLSGFGYGGYYWSSTVSNGSNSYYLYFSASNVVPAFYSSRGNGFPVRCMVSSS